MVIDREAMGYYGMDIFGYISTSGEMNVCLRHKISIYLNLNGESRDRP